MMETGVEKTVPLNEIIFDVDAFRENSEHEETNSDSESDDDVSVKFLGVRTTSNFFSPSEKMTETLFWTPFGNFPKNQQKNHPKNRPKNQQKNSVLPTFEVGIHKYHQGEEVFTKWEEDGRWYSALMSGSHNSKFRVEWCEGGRVHIVDPEKVIGAKNILQKNRLVYIIFDSKTNYEEMKMVEYKGQGGVHLFQTVEGTLLARKFIEAKPVIDVEEVERWKSSQSGKKRPCSSDSAHPSDCDSRSSSEEPRLRGPLRKIKSFTERALEIIPPPLPVTELVALPASSSRPSLQPLADCAFIFTTAADKDATFDRTMLLDLVAKLGGTVLKTFEDLAKTSGQRFLVASSACRTGKYFQCLAADIPCVSHRWFFEVEKQKNKKRNLNFAEYRLPSGISAVTMKTVRWMPRRALLDDLQVGVFGPICLHDVWITTLQAGRAAPFVLEEANINDNVLGKMDFVIVLEGGPSPALITACRRKSLPLVALEWLIQTLIHGTRQEFASWPSIRPTETSLK